jgi:hypothetical protein
VNINIIIIEDNSAEEILIIIFVIVIPMSILTTGMVAKIVKDSPGKK